MDDDPLVQRQQIKDRTPLHFSLKLRGIGFLKLRGICFLKLRGVGFLNSRILDSNSITLIYRWSASITSDAAWPRQNGTLPVGVVMPRIRQRHREG